MELDCQKHTNHNSNQTAMLYDFTYLLLYIRHTEQYLTNTTSLLLPGK